jgi:hypothetical protein
MRSMHVFFRPDEKYIYRGRSPRSIYFHGLIKKNKHVLTDVERLQLFYYNINTNIILSCDLLIHDTILKIHI